MHRLVSSSEVCLIGVPEVNTGTASSSIINMENIGTLQNLSEQLLSVLLCYARGLRDQNICLINSARVFM